MSLSNKDIENLKKKLNNNINLSSKSKTNLNAFINNKKNAFDRTAFMQAYNVKMTNLRSKESSLGKRKRPSGNLNSAMENNTGNVSGGSVNPNKNGRMSPSGTPNNGINFSSKKARFTFPFRTAAMGAANNIRMKAVANVKRKAIIDRQQANANAKEKAVANKVNANARENAELLMNVSRKAAAEKAATINAKAKANANAKAKAKANANAKAKANANAKTKANANAKTKANANAKTKAAAAIQSVKNANAARARANANARAVAPANSARVSATTLGSPNQSTNNNADSTQASFIQPANKRKGANPGKLMKEGILLYITKRAQRTAGMKGLNNLGKLNKSLRNPNSIKEYDTYAWALLYDMVQSLADTKFEENGKQLKVSPKTLKQIHEKLRQKNVYSSGRTTGGEGNRRVFTETFTRDEIVEFMLLIWLDGSHDAYITSSFLVWLDSPTCKEYFSNRHRELAKSFVGIFPNPTKYAKTFKKKPAEFKNFKTELFKNITGYDTIRKICIETEAIWFFIHEFNPGTSKQMIDKGFAEKQKPTLSGNFERELKLGIKEILNTRQTNEIYSGRGINDLKRTGVKIVSLDMETGGDILSEVIRDTPSFRPYVTVANLIDPGKHMIKTSAGRKDLQLVLSVMQTGSVDLLKNLQSQYYIGPLNFTIMDNFKTKNGKNASLPFLKINLSIKKGGPAFTKNGRISTLDFFNLEVNDKNVLQGATGDQARNGPLNPKARISDNNPFTLRTPEAKMGKFMGDALQYMVVAIQNKYRGRERYFASGDGSACFMYVYFCNKLNIKPKLIIDKGDERIRTIGLRNNVV